LHLLRANDVHDSLATVRESKVLNPKLLHVLFQRHYLLWMKETGEVKTNMFVNEHHEVAHTIDTRMCSWLRCLNVCSD